MEADRDQVTALLLAWRGGDEQALGSLLEVVYSDLRGLAAAYFAREPAGHTLQPTALIHELYLRLIDQTRVQWKNRAHFFGVTAQLMRRILVDHARARDAAKRGAGAEHLSLADFDADSSLAVESGRDLQVLALNAALDKLAELDPQQARVVEMRYFAGLTIEETAEATGLSPATVKREWASARAWLWQEILARRS